MKATTLMSKFSGEINLLWNKVSTHEIEECLKVMDSEDECHDTIIWEPSRSHLRNDESHVGDNFHERVLSDK